MLGELVFPLMTVFVGQIIIINISFVFIWPEIHSTYIILSVWIARHSVFLASSYRMKIEAHIPNFAFVILISFLYCAHPFLNLVFT